MPILQNRGNKRNPAINEVDPDVAEQAATNLPQPPIVPTTNPRLPKQGKGPISGNQTPPPAQPPAFTSGNSGITPTNVGVQSGNNLGGAGQPLADAANPPSQEELYSRALRDLLGSGPRNTAEEEKLLRDQMMRDVGAGQANLNARMGASGFGTSGALSTLGTDMRANAALQAAEAIQGVRQDARDEYLDKVSAGLGFANQDRGMDITEANYQAYIDALNEIFGEQQSVTPEGIDDPSVVQVDTQTGKDGIIRPKGGYAGEDGDFLHFLSQLFGGKV